MLKSNKKDLATFFRNHPHQEGIIVSESKQFIYMKPTKTAGTSILRYFLEKEVSDIFHKQDHPERFEQWMQEITDEKLEEYFIFSVVRNPWDRFVSSAKYLDIPFKELLYNFQEHNKVDNTFRHTLPIHYYTHNNGILYTDTICRFETLQEDMNLVCDRIGISRQPLPQTNRTIHDHYSTYYDQGDVNEVAKIYQLDVKHYGYAFIDIADEIRKQKKSEQQFKYKKIKKQFRRLIKF